MSNLAPPPLAGPKVGRITELTIYLTPAHWQLWPVWEAGRWSEVRKICLGPLVIRWRRPIL